MAQEAKVTHKDCADGHGPSLHPGDLQKGQVSYLHSPQQAGHVTASVNT